MAITHGAVPVQPAPDQPKKSAVASGAAEMVTGDAEKLYAHVAPQSIPAGADVTRPAAEPCFMIVSVAVPAPFSDTALSPPGWADTITDVTLSPTDVGLNRTEKVHAEPGATAAVHVPGVSV